MDKKINMITELFTICDMALIGQDNKLSVIGIFDEVRVKAFPGGIQRAFLVGTVRAEPNTVYDKMTLRLEDSQANDVVPAMTPVLQVGPNGKCNMVIELAGLSFKEPGKYTFALYNEKQTAGLLELNVVSDKPEEPREAYLN